MPTTTSASSNNCWMYSVKVVLISTGVLSIAGILKLSVPFVTDFVVSEVPSFYSFATSWLRPPYLYVVVNCIILGIVAFSKLERKLENSPAAIPATEVTAPGVKLSANARLDSAVYESVVLDGYEYHLKENAAAKISEVQFLNSEAVHGGTDVPESRSSEMAKKGNGDSVTALDSVDEADRLHANGSGLRKKDSMELLLSNESDEPPVSSRFGHRKALRTSPEGKGLGVAKPNRNDTLDNTWKMITEGRAMPLTRHLKKSDTWDSHARKSQPVDRNAPPGPKKSETFHDRSGGGGGVGSSVSLPNRFRREPSLSQDELNRRVEAFIQKFNEEMRMQRQESLDQYQLMSSRGAL